MIGDSVFDSRQSQILSLLHSAQTGSGIRLASSPVRIGGSCSGRREKLNTEFSTAEIKNAWSYKFIFTTHMSLGVLLH
jgi:hypothetical protein